MYLGINLFNLYFNFFEIWCFVSFFENINKQLTILLIFDNGVKFI